MLLLLKLLLQNKLSVLLASKELSPVRVPLLEVVDRGSGSVSELHKELGKFWFWSSANLLAK